MSHWLDDLARRTAASDGGRDWSMFDAFARATSAPLRRRRLFGATGAAVGAAALAGAPLRVADAIAQQGDCTHCGNRGNDPNQPGYCPCYAPTCCRPPDGDGSSGANYCCGPDHQCCFGTRKMTGLRDTCCEPGGTCYVDGEGTAGCCSAFSPIVCRAPSGSVDCCMKDQECRNGECVTKVTCEPGQEECYGRCCDEGEKCDAAWRVCAAPCPDGRPRCAGECCGKDETCDRRSETCVAPCPNGQPRCDGECCPDGQRCKNGVCEECESGREACGQACCESDQYCCNPDLSICCQRGPDVCCGTTGQQDCCTRPATCAKQIVGDNPGVTKDSQTVCCPPERTVTATNQPVCCPPGKVKQPGGGLNTRGGLCCRADKVCGEDCCESLPSFTYNCCGGKCCGPSEDGFVCVNGNCQQASHADPGKRVRAQTDGDVPLKIDCPGGGCAGNVSLSTVGGGTSVAFLAARSVPLGGSRFRIRGRGKKKVEVRLSRRGRKLLKKRKQLRVHATVKTRRAGKTVTITSRPFTLQAPKGRGKRR